jgi:acetylornithine deacetylase
MRFTVGEDAELDNRLLPFDIVRTAAHVLTVPGPNAVVEAARGILALEGWSPCPGHPLLGPVTLAVTTVEGGSRRNVVPGECSYVLDIRTHPDCSAGWIAAAVEERTGARVSVFSDRMKPFSTDEGEAIVQAALRARPGAAIVPSSTMSDGTWTRHLPTVKVGPGESARSHTAGEFITVNELDDGARFYAALVREYFE